MTDHRAARITELRGPHQTARLPRLLCAGAQLGDPRSSVIDHVS
ncbi:hypothetical protein EYZ11_010840 [Aspergillus tanneri]|uniref:Uncharacterized protein n=1 Tax=Aspergillus tanneri TaxID=1220188 RepID=A0A4S3J6H1_9EURO|nr:hypothetical protein EYZ11_010840 [Aspergillus tanneri]